VLISFLRVLPLCSSLADVYSFSAFICHALDHTWFHTIWWWWWWWWWRDELWRLVFFPTVKWRLLAQCTYWCGMFHMNQHIVERIFFWQKILLSFANDIIHHQNAGQSHNTKM
jgi:hypothetical protein